MDGLSRTLIAHEFVNMLCLINSLKDKFSRDVLPLFSKSYNEYMDIEGKIYSLNNCIELLDSSIKYTIDYFENSEISLTKSGESYGI